MIRYILTLLFMLLPVPAEAGAWARGDGNLFIASTLRHPEGAQSYTGTGALYAEYGLSRSLTLGAEYDEIAGARVFFRQSRHREGGDVTATSLGIAQARSNSGDLLFETGLHWGRGIRSPLGPGWINIEARGAVDGAGRWHHAKLDTLVGFRPDDRWMPVLALEAYADPNVTTVQFAPSLALRISPSRHLNFRYRIPLKGDTPRQFDLSLWLEF